MPASPLNHSIIFDGDWKEAEEHLIASAIKESNLQDDSTKPWICYCKRLSGGAVYAAHRPGSERALFACAPVLLGLDVLC